MPEGALLWKTLFDTHDTAETPNQAGSQHNGQKTGKKRAQRTERAARQKYPVWQKHHVHPAHRRAPSTFTMSTHNNTVLDKETKRTCIELIYSAGEEEGGSMRETATRLETKIGGAVGHKYLLELAGKLPKGLTNQGGRLTLRHAVNKQLGLDKLTPAERKHHRSGTAYHASVERRDYTNLELQEAVLRFGKTPVSSSFSPADG